MDSRHATLLPTPSPTPRITAREMGRAWHGGSQFPTSLDFRVIDRNDRFKIWLCAQAFDRRTHAKGCHGGAIGHSGLGVLRCLLFDFLNMKDGRLDPSYEAIAERSGYSRDTVIEGVKRLVAAGIIEKTKRIIRERVKEWCQLAGRMLIMWHTRQTSNAYRVNFPLPDRQQFGDLGTPLFKTKPKAESGSQTETEPTFSSSKTQREDTHNKALTDALLRLAQSTKQQKGSLE